jgi:hypothetical protein
MDPDNILDELGKDLFIQWIILNYFHKDPGDPVISELAQLQRGIARVLVSRQFGGRGISQESHTESMNALTAAAERFARANQSVAA